MGRAYIEMLSVQLLLARTSAAIFTIALCFFLFFGFHQCHRSICPVGECELIRDRFPFVKKKFQKNALGVSFNKESRGIDLFHAEPMFRGDCLLYIQIVLFYIGKVETKRTGKNCLTESILAHDGLDERL